MPQRNPLLRYQQPAGPAALENAVRVPLASLRPNPWQPRQHADPERLQELATDIAARGILEPLVVREVGDGAYEIVAGSRRHAAATQAGLTEVPAVILRLTDEQARGATIAENIHREDLTVEDEARYYAWLEGEGLSARAIATAIGKSHSYVNRRLALLREPGALEAYQTGARGLEPERPESGTARSTNEALSAENEPAPPAYGPLPAPEPARAIAPTAVKGESVFKPFLALHTKLQTLDTGTLPPQTRADLAATIDDLIAELQGLRAELDS